MENPVPSLHPTLAAAIEALRSDGINPTDAEVVWLARLRWPCDHPAGGGLPDLAGAPVNVCGESFWPLHRLAERWFVRAGEMLGEDGNWRTDCYLFAHTRSAPGDRSLLLVNSEDEIRATVADWRLSLPLHDENIADLVRLLRHVDGYVDEAPRTDEKREPVGELDGIAQLCRMFQGTTPDYWRAGISIAETEALLESANSESWAVSDKRTEAIESFLRGVKWVRENHAKH
jgi:hypothetical protein